MKGPVYTCNGADRLFCLRRYLWNAACSSGINGWEDAIRYLLNVACSSAINGWEDVIRYLWNAACSSAINGWEDAIRPSRRNIKVAIVYKKVVTSSSSKGNAVPLIE